MNKILNTLDYTLYVYNDVYHHTESGYSCALLFDYAAFLSKRLHQDMFVGKKSLFANFEVSENDDYQLSLLQPYSGNKEIILHFNNVNELYPKVYSNSTGDYGLVSIKTIAELIHYFPNLKPTQLFSELLNDRNLNTYNNPPVMLFE